MQSGGLRVGGYGIGLYVALALTLGWTARLPAPPARAAASTEQPSRSRGFFDEIFLDRGAREVRPQYREIYEVYRRIPAARKAEVAAWFEQTYGARVHLLPRVLTVDEHVRLRLGVAQRARVLREFLRDVHSGRMRFIEQGIISRDEFIRISRRTGDHWFLGKINPDDWAIAYAPDIIRIENGDWVVLEDNTGDVGGRGDAQHLQQAFFRMLPEFRDVIRPLGERQEHHAALMARYQSRARAHGGGKVVYYTSGRPHADKEYDRLERIYAALGAEVVSPYTRTRLLFDEHGAYTEYEGRPRSRERVGFVILGTNPLNLDWQHPAGREYGLQSTAADYVDDKSIDAALREELAIAMAPHAETGVVDVARLERAVRQTPGWREFEKWQREQPVGLIDAILNGRVGTDCFPGVDIVSDKGFYRFYEKLLHLYFPGEKSILRVARTEPLVTRDARGRVHRREALLAEVEADPGHWVLKNVTGYGGYGVTVGAFVSQAAFKRALDEALRIDPEGWVVQEYFRMSEADGNLVDYRGYSEMTGLDEWVSPWLWGRGAPRKGSKGKVNFSLGGLASVISMVTNRCLSELHYEARPRRAARER